jgi:hypothetical protein
MKVILLAGMMLLRGLAWGEETDCTVVETSERFEVACTGNPSSKNGQLPSEVTITPVQGKHRPKPQFMDEEKSSRMKQIKEQRQPVSVPSQLSEQSNPKLQGN